MNIEQINELFSKYNLTNFQKLKNYYTFNSNNNNLKISSQLFEKMLKAANNTNDKLTVNIPNLKFGIEFEFVGSLLFSDTEAFNEAMIDLLGDSYIFEYRYLHNNGEKWILGKDGSIKYDQDTDIPLYGYELSTPTLILNDKTIEVLTKVISYIKTYLHGEVNSSCGTHIHIGFDSSKIYRDHIETLLAIYSTMESTVFDPIVPTSRRRNKYCRTTSVLLNKKYTKLSARYCRFNYNRECHTFHVECRQLEGTLDLDTIINWLILQSTIIYDIISHIDDCQYLYKLRYNNAFDILFKYKFNNSLIAFFIKRIIDFKSKTIQTCSPPAL